MKRETDLAFQWRETDKQRNERTERQESIRGERDREKNMALAGTNIRWKADKSSYHTV